MKHKFLFRTISALLSFVMLFGVFAFAPANKTITVEAATVFNDALIKQRIDELLDFFGDGKKCFNTTLEDCVCEDEKAKNSCEHCLLSNIIESIWFEPQFGSVTMEQMPYYDCHSCVAFAAFATWYIFKEDNNTNVRLDTIGDFKNTHDALSKNVLIGDHIYYGNSKHTAIVISIDDNGVMILDSNWSESETYPRNIVRKHRIGFNSNETVTIERSTNRDTTVETTVDPAARLVELQNFFSDHKYFTTDGQPDETGSKSYIEDVLACDWFKAQFENVSNSQLPVQYNSATSSGNGGIQCYGFARFAQWYLFKESNTATVVGEYAGTTTYTKANVEANCKFGDIVRFPDKKHSMIFVSCDSNGMKVFDCNYNLNCNVQTHTIKWGEWTGETIVLTRAKNAGNVSQKSQIIDPVFLTLQKGQTFDFTLIDNGSVPVSSLQWTSSNNNVATVDASGKVKAIAPGTATIKATTSDGKYDECTFSVVDVGAECYEEWKLTKIQKYVFPRVEVSGTTYAAYCEDAGYGIDKDECLYIVKHAKGENNSDWGFGFAEHPYLGQSICGWFQLTDRAEKTYDYLPAKPTATISRTGDQLTISWNKVDKATKYNIYKNGLILKADLTSLSFTFTLESNSDTYQVGAVNTDFPYNSIYSVKSVSDTISIPASCKHISAQKMSGEKATCTENGTKEYWHCADCGKNFSDSAYKNEITQNINSWKVIEKLGHNYVSVVTPPTETERGYTTHTCSHCHDSYVDSYTDPIPAVTYGDINGDDNIDAFDYQMLKAFVLGTFKDVTDEQKEAMDVNHDGCADAFDYQMLKAHVLGTYVIQ